MGLPRVWVVLHRKRDSRHQVAIFQGTQPGAPRMNIRVKLDADRKYGRLRSMLHTLKVARHGKVTGKKEKQWLGEGPYTKL